MKKSLELTAALLAILSLFSVTVLFTICVKEYKAEAIVAEDMDAQVIDVAPVAVPVFENEDEKNTEPGTAAKIKATVADAAMAKSAKAAKGASDVKVLIESKPADVKVDADDVKTTTQEQKSSSSEEITTKEDVSTKEETTASDSNALIGTWKATIFEVGLSVELDYEFAENGVLNVNFSESNYNALVERIARLNLSMSADESAANPEGNTDGIGLTDGLVQAPTYEEMKAKLSKTGAWELNGDTLTVTVDGETMTAETKLNEGAKSFVLDPAGDAVMLIKY